MERLLEELCPFIREAGLQRRDSWINGQSSSSKRSMGNLHTIHLMVLAYHFFPGLSIDSGRFVRHL